MPPNLMEGFIPKFYGSTTIGERGQIVIPAEARKDLGLSPSTKVMVFGDPTGKGLMILNAESVAEILAHTSKMLSGFQEIIKSTGTDNE